MKKSQTDIKKNNDYCNYNDNIYDNNNCDCDYSWMIVVIINNDDKNNFYNYNYFNNKMAVTTSMTTMANDGGCWYCYDGVR